MYSQSNQPKNRAYRLIHPLALVLRKFGNDKPLAKILTSALCKKYFLTSNFLVNLKTGNVHEEIMKK